MNSPVTRHLVTLSRAGVAMTQKLPLFPLNTVLFPGAPIQLHIFEERYRLMIGRCLEQSSPFGVVLIRSGSEVSPDDPWVRRQLELADAARRPGAWCAEARARRRDGAAPGRHHRPDQRRRERAPERWALLSGRGRAAPLSHPVLRPAAALSDRLGGLSARGELGRGGRAGQAAAPALHALLGRAQRRHRLRAAGRDAARAVWST